MALDYTIIAQDGFPCLEVSLESGQSVFAEGGAMMSMSPHVTLTPQWKGGARRLLSKESLFINKFTAPHLAGQAGQVVLSGQAPGDIQHISLDETGDILVQSGGFMAASSEVKLSTKWQGLVKGFFSGAGLFLILCSGPGEVFVSSFGGILPLEVSGEYLVDTSHIMAFSKSLHYEITKPGGYKSLLFSGEGLVARFQGEGRLWLQTHQVAAFVNALEEYRPTGRGGIVRSALTSRK